MSVNTHLSLFTDGRALPLYVKFILWSPIASPS